jgi:16S rRNA (guanine(966)-N(2))-methyltransferase RsmD
MRITGGSLRNRKLSTPKGKFVEPAPDMVREAVFSILRNVVEHARVLDLFACSGSFGIEALSRGAESVLFVEKNPAAVRVIEQNLESLGIADRAEAACGDALEVTLLLDERGGSFHLAFVDPPYALSESREGHASLERLLGTLLDDALCEGIVIFRQRKGGDIPLADREDTTVDTRIYGSTQVTFFQRAQTS